MPDSKVEVKACPFCGVIPIVNNYMNYLYGTDLLLHPEGSQCAIGGYGILRTKWNTRSPIANNGVSLEDIEKIIWKHCTPLYEEDIQGHTHTLKGNELLKAIRAKLPTTAINNCVSLEEFRMHVLNVLKKRFPHVGEKSYENIKDAQDEILAKLQPTAPRGGNMIDVVKKAVESGAVVIKPCTANCLNGIITDHEGAEVRDIVCPTCSGREYVITEGEVS